MGNHVQLSTMWLDHGGKESHPIGGSRMGEPPPHVEKARPHMGLMEEIGGKSE